MNILPVEVFDFNGTQMEVVPTEDGLSFYVEANHVCRILGHSNPRKAVADHCRPDGVTKRDVIDNLGRNQVATFVSEPNMYRLIARSNLPAAEDFERWVFEDVLPTIRRKNYYSHAEHLAEKEAQRLKHEAQLKALKSEHDEDLEIAAHKINMPSRYWLKDVIKAQKQADLAEGAKRYAEVTAEVQAEVLAVLKPMLPDLPRRERRDLEAALEWMDKTLRDFKRGRFVSTSY